MATAIETRAPAPSLIRPEIASPLAKLKRAIRTYVVLEGLALAAAWACGWLWATFLIDWGMFRLFGVDYIRDGSDTARIVLRGFFTVTLWGGLAYFLGYKVLYRLLATFNEPALALVYERRFPSILEDRLVTAVELADPKIAERYDYSQAMIEETTRTAAERVGELPLGPVFNRGRLVIRGAIAVLLLLSVVVFAVWATDSAASWFERDVLLQNTYWPRRTILELPDFADSDTKAVPYGCEFKVNIRALKWVVATKENREGWRRLEWGDVDPSLFDGSQRLADRAWELSPECIDSFYIRALPESWRRLSLDEVQARVEALYGEVHSPDLRAFVRQNRLIEPFPSGQVVAPEERAHLAGLGRASMAVVRAHLKELRETQPSPETPKLGLRESSLLPARGLEMLEHELDLATGQRLTPAEVQRLLRILDGSDPAMADAVQALNACFSSVSPPVFPMARIERMVSDRDPVPPRYYDVIGPQLLNASFSLVSPPMLHPDLIQDLAWKSRVFVQRSDLFLAPNDLELLPIGWRTFNASALRKQLEDWQKATAAEQFGQVMTQHLRGLFNELDRRVDRSHVGRRVQFRKLDVPAEVTVEFEQIQTEEERARGKAKRATPKVKRISGTNDYVYEFRKIERPLRFRVVAGDDATPWYTIDVKPLPVLTSLVRHQDELGYLHGSNERVQTGPFPVSVEGSDSKFDVPAGTRLRLEAVASKPLQWVQIKQAGQGEHTPVAKQLGHALTSPLGLAGSMGLVLSAATENQNPLVQSLEHTEGTPNFSFALRELAAEDVRLVLEFQDSDGIIGRRPLNIGVLADKEPEFPRIGFEIVNRKMITNQAIVPFAGHIRDDHGLIGLSYDITVEKPDRTVVKRARFPLRRFSPLVVPEGNRGGLRFDKREQATFGRILSAPLGDARIGDAWFAPLVLGRMPLSGHIGLWQFPGVDGTREYVFDYRPRPGSQPVLDDGDEFFDTLQLRAQRDQPIQVDGKPLPIPYRLVIRILANDNRVQTGPKGNAVAASQESQSPEAFEFTVVEETDLLIEAGKREEQLHDTAEEVVGSLKKQHDLVKKLAAEFASLQPEEFRRVAADMQDVLKVIREERTRVDVEVARGFRAVYRELVLNRCTEAVLSRIDQRICRPLESILQPGMEFARSDEALDRLARLLEADKDKTPREALAAGVSEMDTLIRRLEDIIKEMKKLMEFTKAIQELQRLIKTQEDINRLIQEKYKIEQKRELDDKP